MRTVPKHSKDASAFKQDSFIQVRHLIVVSILCFSVLGLAAYPVPSNAPGTFPKWWFSRGVIVPTNPTNPAPSWPTDYPASDDYAVVNEGQLKNFATQAYNEFQSNIPSSVWATPQGTNLATMVTGWSPSSGDNYQAMNLGQIKAVAKPFYDVLIEAGYVSGYPWTGMGADDYSAGNLGQVKKAFNFSLLPPTPTNLTVMFGGTEATLTWSDSISGVQNYEILYSINDGLTWATLTTVAGTVTSTTVTGLTLGTYYTFQIVASNLSGSSAPSTSDAPPVISLVTPPSATLVP